MRVAIFEGRAFGEGTTNLSPAGGPLFPVPHSATCLTDKTHHTLHSHLSKIRTGNSLHLYRALIPKQIIMNPHHVPTSLTVVL